MPISITTTVCAQLCGRCGTRMVEATSIGTGGQYCPNAECTDTNGPQYQLN